jgi:hypothetical protein
MRTEALELIRGLIERVELHPNADGFRIELIGEIANMVTLSTGTAGSVGSELRWASVKVVAGAGNQRYLQVLQVRVPIVPLSRRGDSGSRHFRPV